MLHHRRVAAHDFGHGVHSGGPQLDTGVDALVKQELEPPPEV